MLSLFPALLSYQFFAITVLRFTAGLVMLYMAYEFTRKREALSRTKFAVIGTIPEWLTLFGSLVLFVSGVLMVIGLYTQAVAIVGMLIALKHVIYARTYREIMPISAGAGLLLFVICLSLLISGAGAFAVDMPL